MKILEGAPINAEARKMSLNKMQDDFEYEMANKMAGMLLENGLITEDELKRIKALNVEKFNPFYGDIFS